MKLGTLNGNRYINIVPVAGVVKDSSGTIGHPLQNKFRIRIIHEDLNGTIIQIDISIIF